MPLTYSLLLKYLVEIITLQFLEFYEINNRMDIQCIRIVYIFSQTVFYMLSKLILYEICLELFLTKTIMKLELLIFIYCLKNRHSITCNIMSFVYYDIFRFNAFKQLTTTCRKCFYKVPKREIILSKKGQSYQIAIQH